MPLLAETARAVDEAVAGAQARGRVPSLVVGVVRDGVLVHVARAGEVPVPDADTGYRIGSITKTMTAVLVLALRDAGQLALDDPLHRHLPGTPVGGATLRQLLGHAAGLQREPEGQWWERSTGQPLDAFLAGVTADKLAYPPHRSHHYSNLAYGLLGAVLRRLTGQDWATLVRTRLLAPLGMERTTYYPAEPYARGYVVHPWHGTLREEPRHDHGSMAPAGQLWSTVDDMAEWSGFLADPDPAVLAPSTLAEMCAPVAISDPDTWTGGHGLGIQLWRSRERVYIGHSGSMPGYLAILLVHRPTRTGLVGFTNAYTMHGTTLPALGLTLLDTVLDREPVPPPPWRPAEGPPPAEVAPLCGRWWWMGREFEVSWHAASQELVVTPLTSSGTAPWRFAADSAHSVDRWRGRAGMNDGEVLRVRRDADGTPAALDIAAFVFTREPREP